MRRADIDTRPDSVEKTFFDLSKGLVTEVSPLGMPGGTTIDEANFEILRDGTRRRRKGVNIESGGVSYDFSGLDSEYPTETSTFATFRWNSVNNNPDLIFVVAKLGAQLHFWNEGDTLSTSKIADTVDLRPYTSYGDSGDTYDYVADENITMAAMHGRLFVTGKVIAPVYITYNETTGFFDVTPLVVRIRDLVGIEDGRGIGDKPATLSASHNYNLANRGWNSTTLGSYYTGQLAEGTITPAPNKYPAKNQIWWKALVRWADDAVGYEMGFSDMDKLRKFDTNAIEREVWGTTSAPQGHLFLNPFDTRLGTTDGVEDVSEDKKLITAIDLVERGATVGPAADGTYSNRLRFKLTCDNNDGGVDWTGGDDITLLGTVVKLALREVNPNGTRKTVTVDLSNLPYDIVSSSPHAPTTTAIYIDYYYTGALLYTIGATSAILNAVVSMGQATKGGFYPKSTGYTTALRPRAVATFAGRVWLAGCDHPELADTILFSQVGSSTVDGAKAYSKMYQAGDPTSEYLNMVQATDGGTIQIPGLSGVQALVQLDSGILVLSSAGIWEISGGQSFFSALSIQVRKLADVEVVSPKAYAFTDKGLIVASPRGLFSVSDNEQSGRLGITSLTVETIQTYWQTIYPDNFHHMQLVYDNALYRLYIFFKRLDTANWKAFDEALVHDMRYDSFYKLTFPKSSQVFTHGVAIINDVSSTNDNQKLKFFVVRVGGILTVLDICDMNQTSFEDYDGGQKIPFLVTGYDGVGEGNYRAQEAAQSAPDHSRHRYSPYVHVFMKRTETGIDEDTLEVINPSSLTMQARWDFVSDVTSGKVGNEQQVYRPRSTGLTEIPFGTVIITKNKVRGRGRSLHMRFEGEADYDAHLLGYSVEYKAERKA